MRNITLAEMNNRYNANTLDSLVGKDIGITALVKYKEHDKTGREYDSMLFVVNGELYRTGSTVFIKCIDRIRVDCISLGIDLSTVMLHIASETTKNGYTVITAKAI